MVLFRQTWLWLFLLVTLELKNQRSVAYLAAPVTQTRVLTHPHKLRPCFVDVGPQSDQQTEPAIATETDASAPISSKQSDLETRRGLLVLITVPVAWGTFEPAIRYVYEIQPPVPAFAFSLTYYMVAAGSLLAAALLSSKKEELRSSWPVMGGIELGSYLFVGNALQVLGLKTIPSDRAAFLLQLTTIFVPLMEGVLARNMFAVSARIWLACVVALLGVGVMGLDGQESVNFDVPKLTEAMSTISSGDLYIVGAAVAYTFHCIRLEGYAKTTSAVKLAASKALTETLLTAVSILVFVLSSSIAGATEGTGSNVFSSFAIESGRDMTSFVGSLLDDVSNGHSIPGLLPTASAILWIGWVTVAYTIYAQSYGQSRVRPVTANLIYTIQPICTAIVAWLVLGETLGAAGYLGGALIGSAVLLVTTVTEKE